MDFYKFCRELISSQRKGELSDYCKKNFDSALNLIGEQPEVCMDELVSLASKIALRRDNDAVELFWSLARKIKGELKSPEEDNFETN